MCGIAGLVSAARTIAGAAGAHMAERLRHRGPDASGVRTFRHCSLGHTRLRIIDLSPLGDQPMPNEDDSVWAVFNGEIYNFTELRSALEANGHRFRSQTDTEVLVHLYEQHGADMPRYLRGMFAFAVWDEARRRLLLGRDRLGIKPLYYRLDGDRLAFASEVRALRRPGDSIDTEALSSFLRLGWVAGPRTIGAGISELLPGHVLVWDDGRVVQRRYWSVPAPGGDEPPDDGQLGEVLVDAVRRHLVADVPVGLFLSAGVDSVVVARLASRVAPGLQTYTVAFEAAHDESADAAALAQQLGVHHEVVPVGQHEAQASVGRFIASMDQPTVDGLNSWVISKAVREAGPVVALSGLGGDELFCGYSTFRHVPRLVRAGRLARPLHTMLGAAADGGLARSGRSAHSRTRRALAGIAAGSWGAAYAAVRGLFSPGELARLWPPSRELEPEPVAVPASVDSHAPAAVVGELELSHYLPFQLLRDTDCMSMAHALEVRVPLLDDGVVEMARQGQGSRTGTWDKRRLVAAVDSSLDPLAARRKRTFTLPIDDWMRGGLRAVTEESIANLGKTELGFDRRELTELWCGYLGGRVGWRSVWALAVLGMWLGEHPSSAPRPDAPLSASAR